MKKYIISFGIWVVSYSLFAQNLIPNESFESGDTGFPNSLSQVNRLDSWSEFESSDWFKEGQVDGIFFTGTGSSNMTAHTGDHYIGFGSCEGAQVKLIETVEPEQYVKVSFWWSPKGQEDTEINLYLLENKAPNSALNDCDNPNIQFEFNEIIQVNAGGPNPIHMPGQWYQYESEEFLVVKGEYNFFALKGTNDGGDFNDSRYLYVDDFVLTAVDACEHPCAPELAPILVSTFPTAMQTSNPDIFGVVNATGISFKVYNQWSSKPFYEYLSYDAAGLINTTEVDPITGISFSYFALRWQATNNNGAYIPFNDTYIYTIRVWNCDESFDSTSTITIFHDGPPIPQVFPEEITRTPPACCIDNWYYQNQDLSGTIFREVADFIAAGESVTSGANGPVVVKSGSYVSFDAGNEVQLKVGFSVESGAEFEATTGYECPPEKTDGKHQMATQAYLDERYPQLTTSLIPGEKDVKVNIYPNPFQEQLTFAYELFNSQEVSLQIFDVMGKRIAMPISGISQTAGRHEFHFDGSDLPEGVYSYLLKIGTSSQSGKIVLQH